MKFNNIFLQEKWGLDKIEVRDNGCGIQESDASFMGQSHYTSKISKHEDLEMVNTYGFRGEALGSLCQVSDLFITTKTAQDAVAMSYTLDQKNLPMTVMVQRLWLAIFSEICLLESNFVAVQKNVRRN